MTDNKITVISPIYNADRYLRKCLESIVNQTYSNLEIILVNDGSTDASGNIIEEYSTRDDRIVAIHKENGGIGSAYRVAFERITGDYVSFVDSDDYLVLNAYEELMAVINRENPDMVHFGVRVFDEAGKELPERQFKTLDIIISDNEEILKSHFELLQHPSLARLFKRELFDNITVFDQNIGIDEMLTPQLLFHCNKAVYTSKAYYNVLARRDSVCRASYSEKGIQDTIKVYRFLSEFMKKHISQYAPYIDVKYFSILISFYHHFLFERDLRKGFANTAIRNDVKRYYQNVRTTEYYKKKSYKFRIMATLIIKCPLIYKLIYWSRERPRRYHCEII